MYYYCQVQNMIVNLRFMNISPLHFGKKKLNSDKKLKYNDYNTPQKKNLKGDLKT